MKILKALMMIAVIMLSLTPCGVWGEIITFAWDQEGEITYLKEWRLYWADTAGGPYDTEPVAIFLFTGGGPSHQEPAEATVTGAPGTTVTKHFVLVACGDIPQQGGTTQYLCSDNSNEISYNFWITAIGCSAPVNFRIESIE